MSLIGLYTVIFEYMFVFVFTY